MIIGMVMAHPAGQRNSGRLGEQEHRAASGRQRLMWCVECRRSILYEPAL
jgi:hypothetical protein